MIRAKQLSTTTGTGAYTTSSTPTGYEALPTGSDPFPYLARDTAVGNWEAGFLTFNGVGYNRIIVARSDGLTGAINWPAGEREILATPLPQSLYAPHLRHNVGSGSPDGQPDAGAANGYGIGSLWFDETNFVLYVCTDPDFPFWTKINLLSGRSGDDLARIGKAGVSVGTTDAGDSSAYGYIAETRSTASQWTTLQHSFDGATATVDLYSSPVGEDSAAILSGRLMLMDSAFAIKVVVFEVVVKWSAGVLAIVGTPTNTTVAEEAALSTETLTLSVSGPNLVVTSSLYGVGARLSAQLKLLHLTNAEPA